MCLPILYHYNCLVSRQAKQDNNLGRDQNRLITDVIGYTATRPRVHVIS